MSYRVHSVKCHYGSIAKELSLITGERLRELGGCQRLIDIIPVEWREAYERAFDQPFVSDPSEIRKIEKDLFRTFPLFYKDSVYKSIVNSRRVNSSDSTRSSNFSVSKFGEYIRPRFRSSRQHVNEIIPSPIVEENQDDLAKSLLIANLRSVLITISREVGYCQGLNFMAAKLLLIENDPKSAFVILSFILRQRHLLVLYDAHSSCLMDYMNTFHKRLRRHNRRVYRHLRAINFPPLSFSIEWFTTCFIVSCPGDLSAAVLDLIVIGFEDIMLSVGLALLDLVEKELLLLNMDCIQDGFKQLLNDADPVEVVHRGLLLWEAERGTGGKYLLNSVDILKLMREICFEPKSGGVDEHPYRRLRLVDRSKADDRQEPSALDDQSSMDSSCYGDDERSEYSSRSRTRPPAHALEGDGLSRRSWRRRRRRRRSRSAKSSASTICSQSYLSRIDFRRSLEDRLGDCDCSLEFMARLPPSLSLSLSLSMSPAPSHCPSSSHCNDSNAGRDGTNGTGLADNISFSNQKLHPKGSSLSRLGRLRRSLPLFAARKGRERADKQKEEVKESDKTLCKDGQFSEEISTSCHWTDALLSVTEDWFLPFVHLSPSYC